MLRFGLATTVLLCFLMACAPAPATVTPTVAVTVAPTATPPPLAAQPYPYTTPLPPPTPTLLDGVYSYAVPFAGTPTPCRRCAPYRAEGGTWQLTLDRGVYRVTHSDTNFQGVGSFTVDDRQLYLFNDPHCYSDVVTYTWVLDGRQLRLSTTADDACGFRLRAKLLTAGSWYREKDGSGHPLDPCEPPNREAAISSHWSMPPECQ